MIQKLTGWITPQRLQGNLNAVPTEVGGALLQAKTVWPSHSEQTIKADEDSDYDGLSLVVVKPVPRLPACMASVAVRPAPTVESVINAVVSASVEHEEILFWYAVQSVSGASYGFTKQSDGYYMSKNAGKSSSYAICKVALWAKEETTFTLNCISYAQANYDYGLVSEIDTMLESSYKADSSGVFKSFKGESSPDVVPLQITVPAGDHFISIKFIKNSSTNSYDDTFKFAVAE